MTYKEKVITKTYFSIGEAVALLTEATGFIITKSKLRFWEKQLELKIPRRNSNPNRKYTSEDLELFRIIVTLNLKYGLTVSSLKILLPSRKLRVKLATFLLNEYFDFKALKNGE